MDKRKLHHYWIKLRPISYWYFLVAFILSVLVSVRALRNNNLEMVRLRENVVKADKAGKGVEEALNELRQFVYTHMNTDLTSGNNAIRPPIQLKETYERLVVAEKKRVSAINKQVNDTAIATCERRFPAGQLANGRVQCVQKYLTENSVSERQIPKELYQFDFVSPVWSPDLAGWSIIASIIFLILFLLRFTLERWLKNQLE